MEADAIMNRKRTSSFLRFLIVDDHKPFRALMSKVLGSFGQVDEAENGRDAVFKFITSRNQGKPYNFILLDYEMPVMNGSETYHMIRMFESDHPLPDKTTTFLLTSGRSDLEEIFSHALEHDSQVHVFGKPFDLKKLSRFLSMPHAAHHFQTAGPGRKTAQKQSESHRRPHAEKKSFA